MRVDLGEFRRAYLAEVHEHLAAVTARLVELEQAAREGNPARKALRELMRLLHTIKGLSAMVGVEVVVTLAHRMETAVRTIEAANGMPDGRSVAALLDGARALERIVADVEHERDPKTPSVAIMSALDLSAASEAPARADGWTLDPAIAEKLGALEFDQIRAGLAAGKRFVSVEFAPSASKAQSGAGITQVRSRIEAIAELIKVLPLAEPLSERAPTGLVFRLLAVSTATDDQLSEAAFGSPVATLLESGAAPRSFGSAVSPTALNVPTLTAPIEDDSEANPDDDDRVFASGNDDRGANPRSVLRVDVERIDDALDRVSTLVVTRARLARAIASLREAGTDTRDLSAVHQELGRQLVELRGAVLRLRMVPVASILDTLPLMMRGLARATGKDVQLAVGVGSAELDKTVGEKILPALVHLIRNAVDHGIEESAERVQLGKSARGTVTVTCIARGSRLVEVKVEDDGRGIDRHAIAARAGETEHESDIDNHHLLELLCRAGLSTREAADTTSGRGMGMDIVRKIVVEELGGEIELTTTPHKGSCFVLRVPLTISVVDAFIVRAGGERFVVPVPAVEEIIDLASDVGAGVDVAGMRFVSRRGLSIPLVELAGLLGLSGEPSSGAAASSQALVIRRGREETVAFAVERVVAQQEAVVRPLDDAFLSLVGISGATDLGDGQPTVVLDLPGLLDRMRTLGDRRDPPPGGAPARTSKGSRSDTMKENAA